MIKRIVNKWINKKRHEGTEGKKDELFLDMKVYKASEKKIVRVLKLGIMRR
jgi:hypothetical protein